MGRKGTDNPALQGTSMSWEMHSVVFETVFETDKNTGDMFPSELSLDRAPLQAQFAGKYIHAELSEKNLQNSN